MKVCIYQGKMQAPGGMGTASYYQRLALESVGVEVTNNIDDDYDLIAIDSFLGDKRLKRKLRSINVPKVVFAHSTIDDFKHSFVLWPLVLYCWYKPWLFWMYKHADVVIPVSDFAKHCLESELLYAHVPMSVINNPICLADFVPKDTNIDACRKCFGLSRDDRFVLGIGIPMERKGIQDFFSIAKEFPEVKFIWLGDCADWIKTKGIKKAIKHRPNNVIMPGYTRQAEFFGALSAASCVLCPTYVENDSYVALEALASKTPFLVRDIGAMEYLEDGKTCFKATTNEEFVSKLQHILSSDCSCIVNAGYEIVKQRSLQIIGNKLKKLFEKLINDKKKSPIKEDSFHD